MDRKLCFDSAETINPIIAGFLFPLFILMLPVIVILLIALGFVVAIVFIPIGALMGPLSLCKQIKPIVFCLFFVCIIPFAILFGVIFTPTLVIIYKVWPYEKRLVKQYCNTLKFLKLQACGWWWWLIYISLVVDWWRYFLIENLNSCEIVKSRNRLQTQFILIYHSNERDRFFGRHS